jgi:hypothetical protein
MKTNTLFDDLDAITRDKKLTWEQRVTDRQALVRISLDTVSPAEAVEAIWQCSLDQNSETRLAAFIDLTDYAPPEVFWPAFAQVWCDCDSTWAQQRLLLGVLRLYGHGRDHLSPEARSFFDALPAPGTIYRGCSRRRIRGVAWTTDRAVAEHFAHGDRGIPVPDPVIATATIAKSAVFTAVVDRNEAELIIDPRRLRALRFEEAPAMAMEEA